MSAKNNTAIDQVNSLTAYLPKIRLKANKNIYSWADKLFFTMVVGASLLHSLKAIIACLGIDRPTLAQINAARTRSASRKFAQSDPISERTLRRHIKVLEAMGLITVVHSRDTNRNSRNAYTVRFPEEVLSCPSEDTVSASICTHDRNIINNTKNDLLEENKANKLDVVFDKEQLAILTTILSWGTWKGLAKRWVQIYSVQELQGGIDYMNDKNIDHDNRGGYMRTIIEGLDKRKEEAKKRTARHCATPDEIATKQYIQTTDSYKRSKPEAAKAGIAMLKGAIKK